MTLSCTKKCFSHLRKGRREVDFLKVVRLVFWSGVVGPGTNFRSLALRARSNFRSLALRARSLALRARTIALRAHSRATRSKARLVSKSRREGENRRDIASPPFSFPWSFVFRHQSLAIRAWGWDRWPIYNSNSSYGYHRETKIYKLYLTEF